MLYLLGRKLGLLLFKQSYIDEEDIDAVRYWFEVTINEFIGLMINVLIGYWIGEVLLTVIYLAVFCILRSYLDGYHCKSAFRCNISSFALYFLAIYLSPFTSVYICIIIGLFSFTVILMNGHSLSKQGVLVTVTVTLFLAIQMLIWRNRDFAIGFIALFQVLFLLMIK